MTIGDMIFNDRPRTIRIKKRTSTQKDNSDRRYASNKMATSKQEQKIKCQD